MEQFGLCTHFSCLAEVQGNDFPSLTLTPPHLSARYRANSLQQSNTQGTLVSGASQEAPNSSMALPGSLAASKCSSCA